MATDIEEIKKSIHLREDGAETLSKALDEDRHETLDILKEKNEFEIKRNNQRIGWLGYCFGDENQFGNSVAFTVIFLSFIAIGFCLFKSQDSSLVENIQQKYITYVERFIALVATALAYIFGKSSANNAK